MLNWKFIRAYHNGFAFVAVLKIGNEEMTYNAKSLQTYIQNTNNIGCEVHHLALAELNRLKSKMTTTELLNAIVDMNDPRRYFTGEQCRKCKQTINLVCFPYRPNWGCKCGAENLCNNHFNLILHETPDIGLSASLCHLAAEIGRKEKPTLPYDRETLKQTATNLRQQVGDLPIPQTMPNPSTPEFKAWLGIQFLNKLEAELPTASNLTDLLIFAQEAKEAFNSHEL